MPDDPKCPASAGHTMLARPLLAGAIASIALVSPASGQAAFEIFLQLEGIPGESAGSKHKDEIDVVSYSFGFAGSPAQVIRGSAKPACDPLDIAKRLDRASPKLMERAVNGAPIANGRLLVRTLGVQQVDVLTIQMQNIVVVATTHSLAEDGTVTLESASLRPAIYTLRYVPMDQKGTPGPAVTFGWNCTTSQPVPVP